MKKQPPIKHPIQYSIFKPNNLINADRSELKGIEIAVYNEILNNNHKNTPDVLVYRVPYTLISYDPSKNGARDRKRVGQALQSRSIYLDEQFVKDYLGETSPRSIAPFPEVVYNKDNLEIHLSPKFKRILTMLELGFTKGDIETLRRFTHDVSHKFYWVARQKQTFKQVWKISVEDFREALFITGHADWRNFKRKVIENIQEDMRGSWVEFDIEYVKKGRGGSVTDLIIKFRKGPDDEKDEPVGTSFNWEKTLLNMGVDERLIKQFRQSVRRGEQSESENGEVFTWDSMYIEFSIDAAREEFEAKRANANRRKVDNVPAWFVSGLIVGRWLKYVDAQRIEFMGSVQAKLDF